MGRTPEQLKELRRAALAVKQDASRRSPSEPDGIRKIHVGSGPMHVRQDWWNVDLLEFKTTDQTMDATKPWPWTDIEFVYAEHFLEHLSLGDAVNFLTEAGRALRLEGRIRLSTPSLEHELKRFQFDLDDAGMVGQTLGLNRAFHGWGHQFLYTGPMLHRLLEDVGYVDIGFFNYGESHTPALAGLERHLNGRGFKNGYQGVWIVEGARSDRPIGISPERLEEYRESFIKYLGKH